MSPEFYLDGKQFHDRTVLRYAGRKEVTLADRRYVQRDAWDQWAVWRYPDTEWRNRCPWFDLAAVASLTLTRLFDAQPNRGAPSEMFARRSFRWYTHQQDRKWCTVGRLRLCCNVPTSACAADRMQIA